uniref:Growth-regulating factor n=2 Tax=Rhizophora mucronata TaxID=61149 RepID=A0A2P2J5J1_RHIMU
MTPSLNASVPFTAAQLQELERQTIIFKCMMASVPVPPELLLPITRSLSSAPPVQSNSNAPRGSLEPGISSYNSDPEPWRCKRTDGKKWRCSRDVVPDQKYCERHSHKSRPRSRKHVESRTDSNLTTPANSSYSSSNYMPSAPFASQKPNFPHQINSHFPMFPNTMVSAPTIYSQPRSLEWFLRGETVPVGLNPNLEWHHSKGHTNNCDGKVYYHNARAQRHREEQLNSKEYLNLGGGQSLQALWPNDHCSLSLSPKSASLEAAVSAGQTQARETRHLIDAWSTALTENIDGNRNRNSVSSGENLLPSSSLTLSMPGRSETDEENEDAKETSFGIVGLERKSVGVSSGQWMIPPVPESWMSSPPGGPLAEALILGISDRTKAASNLTTPYDSIG